MVTRFLVADDSAVIRKVARRILEAERRYEVIEAVDAREVIGRCEVSMPDAILLDWSLPDADGCDVLRNIRRMPDGKAPKIVLLLSENDVAHIARARHLGASETMLKPFDKRMFLDKLKDLGLAA
jgi:two-component system chemotaxis response regulator CheY